MIEIEKGVEIPERKSTGGRPAKYPFREMEIGDSFFVECRDDSYAKTQSILVSSASLQLGAGKVTSRRVEGGVRVWRIK